MPYSVACGSMPVSMPKHVPQRRRKVGGAAARPLAPASCAAAALPLKQQQPATCARPVLTKSFFLTKRARSQW